MLVPVKCAECSESIKGSLFLSESFILEDSMQVKEILKSQKKKYSDATHVCHAFIFGKNGEIMGMSDDGEPGGTAGRPMLDVLKGRGVTNILVTVTRWFGGTLLGTGGLVHAYGEGAKNVLEKTVFQELIEKVCFSFKVDYKSYSAVKKSMENWSIFELKEEFNEEICVSGKIPEDDFLAFKEKIFDVSRGKCIPEVISIP